VAGERAQEDPVVRRIAPWRLAIGCPDGLIVRGPRIDNMTQVINGLLDIGEFDQTLQPLQPLNDD
jgi:hypothetical protein